MFRVGASSAGNVWVSKIVGGGILGCFGLIFSIIGILGIIAFVYSLT